jgi:hypothetical protein
VTDILAALRTGAVDAGVINAELAILARRDGFRDVADISKMGLSFPTSSIVTTRSYIKRNENTVQKIHPRLRRRRPLRQDAGAPSASQAMSKYYAQQRPGIGQRSSTICTSCQNIPRIPRPTPEPIKTVPRPDGRTDPRVANLKPEQFIDGRFFAELEKEGFIQKLWNVRISRMRLTWSSAARRLWRVRWNDGLGRRLVWRVKPH